MRVEKDTLGEVRVPADRLWGAQTQRSLENFRIGEEKMPIEIIRAFAVLKGAAAAVNGQLGVLSQEKVGAIMRAADAIYAGDYDGEFPLAVWQTGSGTHTNMNVNEVIANIAFAKDGILLHPNDDVNKSQSSNDTFPTAMHIAAAELAENKLFPAADALIKTFCELKEKSKDTVKIGRTHLMDATPLTLGQEISAWEDMLKTCKAAAEKALEPVYLLALGGTAVGTGLGSPKGFAEKVAEEISHRTGKKFATASNKFRALSSQDAICGFHGALKTFAADLLKIANDVRLLASGPRCGIGEITIPANEPGSSIMPGKVNPTQCEALSMVAVRVLGNDTAVGFAASQGAFQLNVYLPLIAYTTLQSIGLLSDAINSFNEHCAKGIRPNEEKIAENLKKSLMLVTALSPRLGYDKAAEIAKFAYENGIGLKEAAVGRGVLTAEEFDALVDPKLMV